MKIYSKQSHKKLYSVFVKKKTFVFIISIELKKKQLVKNESQFSQTIKQLKCLTDKKLLVGTYTY